MPETYTPDEVMAMTPAEFEEACRNFCEQARAAEFRFQQAAELERIRERFAREDEEDARRRTR